jgi:hypothetical protein
VGQTLLHLSSGRSRIVNLRFACFLTQVGCFVAMLAMLLAA